MVKNIRYLLTCILCALSFLSFAQDAPLGEDYLLIAADPWCPFNCAPDSQREGIMVDLAREAMRAKGIKVKYVNRPWKRAILEAKKGVIDGIIGAGLSDGKGLILPNTPYAMATQGVAVSKSDSFEWNGAMSIGGRRLVKISGYGYGGVLDDFLEQYQGTGQIIENSGENVLARNLKMISLGRADITLDEINVLKMTAADENLHQNFRFLKTGRINPLYIALSPNIERSQQIADWLDEEILKMNQDGRYKEIVRKYDMEPWL